MKQRILTYPSDIQGNAGFLLTRRRIAAGTVYPIHWHDFYEFEIIRSGQAEHIHNNTRSVVSEGSAFLICLNDFHGITALTDLELYSIHFSKDLLPPELADYIEVGKFACWFDSEQARGVTEKLLQMDTEARTDQPFADRMIRDLLEQILIALIRKSPEARDHIPPSPVRRAVVHLRSNFRRDITLTELSRTVSLSPNYLGQLFKAETGQTFNAYLNALRLKYACSLLESSGLSVKEVAFAAGYRSVEYFLAVFRKNMRMTPSQYRADVSLRRT